VSDGGRQKIAKATWRFHPPARRHVFDTVLKHGWLFAPCHGATMAGKKKFKTTPFVLPAFGHVLPICIGQNILVNESIFFMPFILFCVRMLDIFHSITNEWAKFDTKDMFFFYFFSHASPTSTT
jgi:hypothetical protein